MSLTIVLSGVANYRAQVTAALTAAGFRVLDADEDHGLPVTVDGEEPQDGSHMLLTCEGEDLDAAVSAVTGFGWVLRLHRHTAPASDPFVAVPADHPAALLARIEALEARLA